MSYGKGKGRMGYVYWDWEKTFDCFFISYTHIISLYNTSMQQLNAFCCNVVRSYEFSELALPNYIPTLLLCDMSEWQTESKFRPDAPRLYLYFQKAWHSFFFTKPLPRSLLYNQSLQNKESQYFFIMIH